MVALNELADNPGARKNRIRVGRGIGCGKGKTCGRGVKGQKSRTGVAIKGFEGGQMPIFRRLPKRGFTNIHRIAYAVVNVSDLQQAYDDGKIESKSTLNKEIFVSLGLVRSSDVNIKLLGKGALNAAVSVTVDAISESARNAIESAGGTVNLTKGA